MPEELEGFRRKFESYCSELGGEFTDEFPNLKCTNLKRMPDPKQVVRLAKEARDILGEGDEIRLDFVIGDYGFSRGEASIGISSSGVSYLFLEKEILGYLAAQRELGSHFDRLRSILEYFQGRSDLYSICDEEDFLQYESWFEEWDERDWAKLEELLREAKVILEWKAGNVKQMTKRTVLID